MKLSAELCGHYATSDGGSARSHRRDRRWNLRGSCQYFASLLGLIVAMRSAPAQVATWTGAGADDLWSNAANWSGGIPVDGGSVVFGVDGGGENILNYSLSLTQFRFAPQILPEHNFHLASGAALTLTGFGIDNVSRIPGFGQPPIPPGVIRQQFFMEAGSVLTFQNMAMVGGSDPVFNLPVDLNARGGTSSGGVGGRIIFEDSSTASGPPANTFTGLRIFGGTVAGAGGGELIFRENATMGFTGTFALLAGDVAGALGGTAIFEGNAVASSGSNSILTGTGFGGRVIFRENAQATGSVALNNSGAVSLEGGNEAVTQFLDDSTLDGFVQNFAGQDVGMKGGRTEFRQRAVFGGTNGGLIINGGSFLGGEGGLTIFYDDTRIVGAGAIILNRTEREGSNPGSIGGVTEFRGNSRAGAATINNDGATSSAAGTLGGRTFFLENSSAENATIAAGGGAREAGAVGASVEFSGASTAANATLTALSGTDGGAGGRIIFSETASGGAASVTVELGGVFDMSALTTAGTTLGSIAGAGDFFLGGKSLTVGSNHTSTVVGGIISDGGAAGGAGAGLTKVGTGTLELGGINTYSGPTNVSVGKLLVTGALADGAVAVVGSATLGGTGTIGGAVTVANAGIVAPGRTGAGTLTVGALTLNAGSILDYQLGSLSDRIDVNGPLTLDGTLHVGALSGLTVGIYRLINYLGAFTNNILALGSVPAGTSASDFSIQTDVAGQVNLVLNGGAGELLFWDGANLSANGVVNGGTFSWTNSPTNWTNSAGTVNQSWASQKAVFTGAAGTVTLGENVSATGLQFVTTDYVVNAAAGETISLLGTTPVRVDAGSTATINAALTGGALDKTGDGQLVLTGNNSFSGGLTVTDGLLTVRQTSLALGSGPVTVRASNTTTLFFSTNSSAGSVAITNQGGATLSNAGFILFRGTGASAGSATITNEGNTAAGGGGAVIEFDAGTTAGSATIHNLGGAFTDPTPGAVFTRGGGFLAFTESGSAGSATITNHAALGDQFGRGRTSFQRESSAGSSTILNRGATVAGAPGGLTDFRGTATAATATLIVEGGSNGGGGGSVLFRETATGGLPRVIFQPGMDGTADGLLDISATSFTTIGIGSIEGNGLIALGSKRLELGGNNASTTFAGAIAGFGGSLRKVGTGGIVLSAASTYTGGTVIDGGAINPTVTGAVGTGPVTVNATGRISFMGAASAANLAIANATSLGVTGGGFTAFSANASAGAANILNRGGNITTDFGGQVQFSGDATAASATIFNESALAASGALNGGAGLTAFLGNSTGGSATITNRGSPFPNGSGVASTIFAESAKAGTATLHNEGGVNANGAGGHTQFFSGTSAESATLRNFSGQVANGRGGRTFFDFGSTAGSAAIFNMGASVSGAAAGDTSFFTGSTAGAATVRNARAAVSGAPGGLTTFFGTSNAGTSDITNEGAQAGLFGITIFADSSSAQDATFHNEAALAGSNFGGQTQFLHASTAGTALFDNEGSKVAGGLAGVVHFFANASAEASEILNRGSTVAGGTEGGVAFFFNSTKAGTATIRNEGSAIAAGAGAIPGGRTEFSDSASAEQATITNRAPTGASGSAGLTRFNGTSSTVFSTADRATITNEGGLFTFQYGGRTEFRGTAHGGTAMITNAGAAGTDARGGLTEFFNAASAGAATIASLGSSLSGANPAQTIFHNTSTAGTATIVAGGSAPGGRGAETIFFDTATAGAGTVRSQAALAPGGSSGFSVFRVASRAGSAMLIAEAGAAGAAGGEVHFWENSEGETARAIIEGAPGSFGTLDISFLADAGTTLGSLEGGGVVRLGSKNLAVGGNHLSTLFSGAIRDGGIVAATGGSLTKTGTGTLELSGANTFTGLTQISGGTLRISGSIVGAVQVNNGGTLGGNGILGGGVIVGAGGVVSPGASIGSFSTLGAMNFGTDSIYGLEIDSGAQTADAFSAVNVTIGAGVNLFGQEIGAGALLPFGLQFRIIDNTSENATAGFFDGLGEGAQFGVGSNLFAISYTGGDGNDVVLTSLGIPEPSASVLLMSGALFLVRRRR